ncbi:MAG: LamG-like jellyroll fold domain-containing protein [Methylovulum sp.]|nr:LamG-like jellyroll fold domain-containing protein [Methylovulum sp.]
MNHAVENKLPRFFASRWQAVLVMFLLAFGMNGQANAGLNDGLVAYWSFDDCTAKDNSGNGHDGVITDSLPCSTSKNGKAVYFDGTGSIITVPNTQSLKIDNKITISALVSIDQDNSDAAQIIQKGQSGTIWDYGLGAYYSYPSYRSWEADWFSTDTQTLPSKYGQYHLLTAVVDENNPSNPISTYLDGVKITGTTLGNQWISTSNQQYGFINQSDYPLVIGVGHAGDNYKGYIDELRIYNRALTATEVTALYQQGQKTCTKVANNPCYQEIKNEITALAKEKNIPPVIIQAIAFQESGWLHSYQNPTALQSCVSDIGVPNVKYRCESSTVAGIGLMQVTVPISTPDFNQLSSDWKYNLRAGVDKLWSKWQTQRTEAPNDTGFDIDPTVIEAWYYPVMWYNGQGAGKGFDAWKYVKNVFTYMSAEPPQNLLNVWDKVTGIKNPQGIIDMPNKENYHVKDLALKSVPIHQWNPSTGKYADITSQVLNGETPTSQPVIVKDKGNWFPKTDGFDMPVSNWEISGGNNYGNHLDEIINGHHYNGLHPGEDWITTGVVGKPIFSIANGVVEDIKTSTTLGYGLIIRHESPGSDGYIYSVYYHVNQPLVKKGDIIYRGQKVATIGSFTGVGPHLHFELRNKLPKDIYQNDMGDGYYADTSKMLLDGFFIAPSTFVSENALSSVSSDVSALMKTYQNAGLINKTLNQYFVEKRGQFIAILIRALEKRANKTLAEAADLPYTDVPLNSGIRSSLLKACELKILAACAGIAQTKFNPDMPITRQEALAFTVRVYEALKQPIVFDSTKANTFVDVPETNGFNQTVVKGHQVGLTSGVVDGTYRYFYPARWVQRGEAVSFVEKLVIQLNTK